MIIVTESIVYIMQTNIDIEKRRIMSYTIGEVAEMMGVTPSTLRYYDQEGLFPEVNRVNGIRVFEDKDCFLFSSKASDIVGIQ